MKPCLGTIATWLNAIVIVPHCQMDEMCVVRSSDGVRQSRRWLTVGMFRDFE